MVLNATFNNISVISLLIVDIQKICKYIIIIIIIITIVLFEQSNYIDCIYF